MQNCVYCVIKISQDTNETLNPRWKCITIYSYCAYYGVMVIYFTFLVSIFYILRIYITLRIIFR